MVYNIIMEQRLIWKNNGKSIRFKSIRNMGGDVYQTFVLQALDPETMVGFTTWKDSLGYWATYRNDSGRIITAKFGHDWSNYIEQFTRWMKGLSK
jgi:hypothetical protein